MQKKPIITLQSSSTHAIPEKIFGQFLERASFGEPGPEEYCDENGELFPDAIKLMQDMSVPVIRFPGGTDIDYINWQDLIDNVPGRSGSGRPITRGGNFTIKEPHKNTITNNFGWDEYWVLQKTLKNETILVLNFLEACAQKRPLKQATIDHVGLVAYCNAKLGAHLPEGMPDWPAIRAENGHPEPYNAEYVQIGNEWFLQRWRHDVLVGLGINTNITKKTASPKDIQKVTDWMTKSLLSYIRCIRAIDNDIKIIIDMNMLFDVDKVVLAHPEIRREVHFLALHDYAPMHGFQVKIKNEEIKEKELKPEELNRKDYWYRLSAMPGIYQNGIVSDFNWANSDMYTNMGYKMAYTEWNWNGWQWNKGDESTQTDWHHAAGIGVAAMYHGFFRIGYKCELACQSMLLGKGWSIAAINYSGHNDAPLHYGAQGQVSWFYGKYHGNEFLPLNIENNKFHHSPYIIGNRTHTVAMIDACATQDTENIYLHIINRSLDVSQNINISGLNTSTKSAEIISLIPRTQPAQNKFRYFDVIEDKKDITGREITLAPQSINCLIINK